MSPRDGSLGQRSGLRSASRAQAYAAYDETLVASLRGAIRDVFDRYKAYKDRIKLLEAEADKKLGDYAAETARKLRDWGSNPKINGAFVETQLQSRNMQYKNIENREADRQISNRASFELDLESILDGILKKDSHILETNGVAENTMVADEPPIQPSPTPSTRKRPRETDSPRVSGQPESPRVKRVKRVSETTNTTGNPLEIELARTITFEEVYQGGKAIDKHAILTHPSVPAGTWLIVKCECEDHIVHFGSPKSALQGAAKHLDTGYHQMKRSYRGAVEHFGYKVLGCDREKAAANNAVFEKALKEGYVPVNTRNGSGRKSFVGPGNGAAKVATAPEPANNPPTKNTLITRVKGGELYYAWWPDDGKHYLCMILPWDNSRDFGLTEVRIGIHGLGLLDKKQTHVPKCYTVDCDLDPPRISGWYEGYEDGGPKESKRFFPALYFHPPKNQSSWTKASFLRPFDWRRPKYDDPGYKLSPQSVKTALEAMAKAQGFSSFAKFEAAQRGANASGREARHGEPVTTPVQKGDDSEVQNEIEVASEESDVSSPGEPPVDEGGNRFVADTLPIDDVPEGAATPNNGLREKPANVPTPDAEPAPFPGKHQVNPASPANKGPAQNRFTASASENGTVGNDVATPASTRVAKAMQSKAPPRPSSSSGDVTTAKQGSSPATTSIERSAQSRALPKAAEPLMARKSQPGKKFPTMTASPPVTPAGPRQPPGLLPKPNVNSPGVTPATVAGRRPNPDLPPKSPKVNSPSSTTASTNSAAGTQSPATGKPAQMAGTQKPAAVASPAVATASSKPAPKPQSATATLVQTPPASQPIPKAPVTNSRAVPRIQTQVPPSPQAGPQSGISSASSPVNSLRSNTTPRNATAATDAHRFYLSEYEGPDTIWNAVTDSERLVLEIDTKTQTAKTGQRQPVTLEIDPKRVTSHVQFRDRPQPGKHTLTLNMKSPATEVLQEHRLVFDQGGGVSASRQARRFFSWVSGW